MKGNWTCYMLAWSLAVANVVWADAQTGPYPNKPVQIITDSSAGSTPDVALRFVADGLTQVWKQQVLVNNHPGAGGSLAVRLAAAAAPDGYTLYQPVLSTFISLRPAAPNVPIHMPQDFSADRVRGGEPDVYRGLSISRHLDPAGADRACQKSSWRNHLCHDRDRTPDPSDRGPVAARSRDQAAASALYRRSVPRRHRRRNRPRCYDHRRLFRRRGSGPIGFD